MIRFDETKQVFHLTNKRISYLLQIEEGGYLAHLYFGEKVGHYSGGYQYPRADRSFSPNLPQSTDRLFSLDTLMQEFPSNGFGDFRESAYQIQHEDGSFVTPFVYRKHTMIKGKPTLAGLPQTYVETADAAETLIITLIDEAKGLELDLYYTIFQHRNVITRSAKIRNQGDTTVVIRQLASQVLDFPKQELDLIHFHGTWAKERQIIRERINSGIKKLDSKRGSSSAQQNPFITLATPQTTEFAGSCYGFCLVYSGNHETIIERDSYEQTRVIMGINQHQFAWQLTAGATFQTPEAVMVYSSDGLNAMSQEYHDLFNHHIVRGRYKLKDRPTLINNWEATYFDFNEEKLLKIVEDAKDLGIEMFVLDDGWFGHRESDRSSLGDWVENPGKIASGLANFAKKVHERGLLFGLWFEPEMISEDSQLFEEHPEWALQIPGRDKSLSRDQYVLDFSREDVREHIYQKMQNILDTVDIDYIKWDMNRNMTEVYSSLLHPNQQGEVSHRYMLGLYEFLERLTMEYPQILFESCSGGGGRFDAGMLYYMPQTWTSDNTDAIARLKIQYGTSYVYPISSMGSHVSAVPNHQTDRITDLTIRGGVAMSGVLGYELDLTKLTSEEKNQIKEQLIFYRKNRQLFQYGTFIRLLNPFESNDAAWMFVSKDRKEAIVFYFRILAEASQPFVTLKLAGLDPNQRYEMLDQTFYGDELMNIGIYIDAALSGDFAVQMMQLKSVSEDEPTQIKTGI